MKNTYLLQLSLTILTFHGAQNVNILPQKLSALGIYMLVVLMFYIQYIGVQKDSFGYVRL